LREGIEQGSDNCSANSRPCFSFAQLGACRCLQVGFETRAVCGLTASLMKNCPGWAALGMGGSHGGSGGQHEGQEKFAKFGYHGQPSNARHTHFRPSSMPSATGIRCHGRVGPRIASRFDLVAIISHGRNGKPTLLFDNFEHGGWAGGVEKLSSQSLPPPINNPPIVCRAMRRAGVFSGARFCRRRV